MNYEDLDKHFTKPKIISPFYRYKKVPRKLKKKCKKWLEQNYLTTEGLSINQQLWYLLELTNPNYKRFIIKQIIEHESSTN